MGSGNWIVDNLNSALEMWNGRLAEIWQLISTSPESFKGGGVWNVIVNINDGSLLIIPRLPFAYPDARKERELEKYSSLHAFIREVAVPEMQIKLRQGFGRAIRTESDTCVIAILDERACRGRRYAQAVSEALPEMQRTGSLREVTRFLREKKQESYFEVER